MLTEVLKRDDNQDGSQDPLPVPEPEGQEGVIPAVLARIEGPPPSYGSGEVVGEIIGGRNIGEDRLVEVINVDSHQSTAEVRCSICSHLYAHDSWCANCLFG